MEKQIAVSGTTAELINCLAKYENLCDEIELAITSRYEDEAEHILSTRFSPIMKAFGDTLRQELESNIWETIAQSGRDDTKVVMI